MRNFLMQLLFLISFFVNSQEIFDYEKKINEPENYNFIEYEVLNTESKIALFGTLIAPKREYDKIVLIIPGSGRDTRHSHYYLAENLLKSNIAVFRFDERGIGKSEGEYSELASDLSKDLYYFLQKLQSIYSDKKIGIIGHSIGGIAALENSKSGLKCDYLILIETPVIKNGQFILNQLEEDYENSLPSKIRKNKSKEQVLVFLNDYFDLIAKNEAKNKIKKFIKDRGFNSKFIFLMEDDFLVEMLKMNLEKNVKSIQIPLLYLTGTSDKIINHTKEVALINSFNNSNCEVKIYDQLNHWLTKKGAKIGTSLYLMDQEPLNDIISWIEIK